MFPCERTRSQNAYRRTDLHTARSDIRFGRIVSKIEGLPDGVIVSHGHDAVSHGEHIRADYAVVTTPLPVLARIETNFEYAFSNAIRSASYVSACKVAWQSPRFWETRDHIYGGQSYVGEELDVLSYPSNGLFMKNGIIVAGYNTGPAADRFGNHSRRVQLSISRKTVETLHPGQSRLLTRPMVVCWQKVPFSMGAWASRELSQSAEYALLNTPQGKVYLAGEHLSHVSGWQEGAVVSALRAVRLIASDTIAKQTGLWRNIL